MCWCWRLKQRSGIALGFTDHDQDIAFDGTIFEAGSGFTSSEIKETAGFAVDNLELEGALSSPQLSETALAAGDFDDAEVEIFRVDWSDPESRILMRSGSIGEVRRTANAFTAEVRGLSHYLHQSQGRVFQVLCDAELGDSRCSINLNTPSLRAIGVVGTAISDRVFFTSDLSSFQDGWFSRGLITFTGGENTGRSIEVKRHSRQGSHVVLEVWQQLGNRIAVGDAFVVTAGCDKQHATCREKFSNVTNYRGFPNMPGNDFLTSPRVNR